MPPNEIGGPSQSRLPQCQHLNRRISITIMEAAQSAPPVGSIVRRHWWRGEVQAPGGARNFIIPVQNNEPATPTIEELGLSAKDVFEARQIRDAEVADGPPRGWPPEGGDAA